MISDKTQMIVAAKQKFSYGAYGMKIFVIDAKTLAATQTLETEEKGDFVIGRIYEVKLAMDENFLVAYIHDFRENGNSSWDSYTYQVWKRLDYSPFPQRQPCNEEWSQKINTKLSNIPLLLNGCVLIFLREILDERGHAMEYDEWNLHNNSRKIVQVYQSGATNIRPALVYQLFKPPKGFYYRQRNGKRAIEAFDYKNNITQYTDFGVLINGTLSTRPSWGPFHKVIGISDNYLAIASENCSFCYKIEGGQLKLCYKILKEIYLRADVNDEIQFDNNRIAFKTTQNDVVVGDLSTEAVIIYCEKDLGFKKIGCFNLQKDCLWIEDSDQLYVVKFRA